MGSTDVAESSALLAAIDRHEFDDSQLIRDVTNPALGMIRVRFDNQPPTQPLTISQEQTNAPEALRVGTQTVGRRLDDGSRLQLPDPPYGRVRVMAVTGVSQR